MLNSSQYSDCQLCPRHCSVDRTAGQTGWCGETSTCRIAVATAHHGEEPCISGTRGSGTIFFSGCSCQCFFCQNYQISLDHNGEPITADELLTKARTLADNGVHNLNFVTPDHFWPHIRYVCTTLRKEGFMLPFICNGSGYHKPEIITEMADIFDIFLPDIKYNTSSLSKQCINADDYPEVAFSVLAKMCEQKGFLQPFDNTGNTTAETGVLVRHLVLPGQLENTFGILRKLRREFGRMLPLSVMSQFRPTPRCKKNNLFTRCITRQEYEAVLELLHELDFRQVFLQPDFGDPGFSPEFNNQNPFPGKPK